MKAKRKRHDAQFKAHVAQEALEGIKTVQRIAKEFDDVHPVQVSDWKKKLSSQLGRRSLSLLGVGSRGKTPYDTSSEGRNKLRRPNWGRYNLI